MSSAHREAEGARELLGLEHQIALKSLQAELHDEKEQLARDHVSAVQVCT